MPSAVLLTPALLPASNAEVQIRITSTEAVAAIFTTIEFPNGAETAYFEDRFLPGYTGTWSPSTGILTLNRASGWPESFQITIDVADVAGNRIGVPVQAPARPDQVDGLVAWWRGDQYSAATGVLTDMSGLGNDLVQTVSGDRPSETTAMGQAAIGFSGGDHLEGSAFTGLRESHDLTLVGLVSLDAGGNNGILDLTESPITNDGASVLYTGGNAVFRVALNGSNDASSDATAPVSLGSRYLLCSQTQARRSLAVDSGSAIENVSNRLNERINNVTMGKLAGISSFNFTGSVSEFVVFNRALSASDETMLRTYFNARYGLSLT